MGYTVLHECHLSKQPFRHGMGLPATIPAAEIVTRETPPPLLRSVFDAIFYLLRTGSPWRYLPSNFPPWQTVYYCFRQFCRIGLWTHLWRGLREAERQRVSKDPHPSAAIIDAQSVKTVEESAHISGFDAHTCVKGRKRHLLVDTLGLPISVSVIPADLHDTQGARRRLLAGLKQFVPRLKKIWADAVYRGQRVG